jgi:hypothetical protein
LPMCTVTMAVKMMCIMQHNFRLEFISWFPNFFLIYEETFVSPSESYFFSIILCTIHRRTLIWHPQDWTGIRLTNIPAYQTVPIMT